MDQSKEEEVKEANMATLHQSEEVNATALHQSKEEELKEFDAAASKLLEFLGEVYVRLSGIKAVEECACEQYAASIRFLRRCISGSSQLETLPRDHENLTSRKNPASCSSRPSMRRGVRNSQKQNSRFTRGQIDQTTVPEGGSEVIDGKRLQEIQSLCESIDLVLATAKHVREKSTRETVSKASRIHKSHPESSGRGDRLPVKTSDGVSTAAPKAVDIKVMAVAKAGERPKKLISKKSIKLPGRSIKSQTPSSKVPKASKDLENSEVGTSLKCESADCHPQINSEPLEDKKNEFAKEPAPTGKKTWTKSSLQLPERVTKLLAWFESKGISLNEPIDIPRTESRAAKEAFLSVLNDVSNQQHRPDDKESKDAAARIQETQKVLKELACHVSPFEMNRLLRIAPAGSTIAEIRDLGIREVLKFQQECATSSPGSHQISSSDTLSPPHNQIMTLSWLPQSCWAYFDRAVESLKSGGSKDIIEMLQRPVIHYSEPEEIVRMARLWHVIHVTLFQCYVEEVLAPPLLPKPRPPRNEPSMLDLFRCRLAHSILCKEGSGLMVIAERVRTPV